jgi:hypothetical protein
MPAFVPERKEVWYSEAYTGFYAVKITNGAWPDAKAVPAAPLAPLRTAHAPTAGGGLPATGLPPWLPWAALGLLVLAVVVRHRRIT